MKQLFIAGLFAVTANASVAMPFDYQRQIGSVDYVPDADVAHIDFAPVTPSNTPSSLELLMLLSSDDGMAPNQFSGQIQRSGPTQISLYEVYRDIVD